MNDLDPYQDQHFFKLQSRPINFSHYWIIFYLFDRTAYIKYSCKSSKSYAVCTILEFFTYILKLP